MLLTQSISQKLGVAGLYLFSLSGLFSTLAFNISLVLIVIATLIDHSAFWLRIKNDPVFWLSLAFGIFLLASAQIGINAYPASVDDQYHRTWRYFTIGGFFSVLLAFWMDGNQKRLNIVLILALIGIVIFLLRNFDVTKIYDYLAGQRAMLHHNPNLIGWLSAAGAFGTILIPFACYRIFANLSGFVKFLGVIAFVILLLSFFAFLAWSQSRSAWLAFALTVPISLLAALFTSNQKTSTKIILTLSFMLIFIGAAYSFHKVVLSRLSSESSVYENLLSGEIERISASGSIGARINIWRYGIENFIESPILGWGPGSSKYKVPESSIPGVAEYKHYHNLYLELLVSVGLLGYCTLMAISGYILYSSARSAYHGHGESWYWIATWGLFGLFLVFQFFSTHLSTEGKYYILLVTGMMYTHKVSRRNDSKYHNNEI